MPLRAKSALQVEIVFQSGSTQCFDINDGFLENVKLLLGSGLPPSEICKTWTRNSPGDPARILRIIGKKADGSDVLMELSCEDHAVNPEVPGSSPGRGAGKFKRLRRQA
jgi:hypothetical protein